MGAVRGFTLFETAIGPCALLWHAQALKGVWLPGPNAEAMRAAIVQRHPQARDGDAPGWVADAARRIAALLSGARDDLADLPLDLDGLPAFHQRVYAHARGIVPGRTSTYGEVAAALGEPGAARAVGRALGENPFAIVVPCHRVLAAGGRAGGFSAPGGIDTKRRLLVIEQARIGSEPTLF